MGVRDDFPPSLEGPVAVFAARGPSVGRYR